MRLPLFLKRLHQPPDLTRATSRQRTWLAPVIRQSTTRSPSQTALMCLRAGYGLSASQELVSGLTIADNTLADKPDLAPAIIQAGFQARTTIIPPDMIATADGLALPALIWSQANDEPAHLLIIWNRIGSWFQIMDTANGQRWLSGEQLAQEGVLSTQPLTPAEWHTAASSRAFAAYWQRQLHRLGFDTTQAAQLVTEAVATADWYPSAALDAGIRLTMTMVQRGGIRAGIAARTLLQQLYREACATADQPFAIIPAEYWFVQRSTSDDKNDQPLLLCAGIQIVQGAEPCTNIASADASPTSIFSAPTQSIAPQTIMAFLRTEGNASLSILGLTLAFVTAAVVLQALILRGTIDLLQIFPSTHQRIIIISLLLAFVMLLWLLEWYLTDMIARVGRRLDARLRIAVLERLPLLTMRTIQQRSTADQIERIHAARDLHNLPEFMIRVLRNGLLLLFTLLGIAWIDVLSALAGLLVVAIILGSFQLSTALLEGLNLSTRTRLSHLMRCSLDSMLGLVSIQAHSAERTMRQVYDSYLVRWIRSMLNLAQAEFWIATLGQSLAYILIAATIVLFAATSNSLIALPLLLFWLLQLASIGREFARSVFRYQNEQSKCTRFAELLDDTPLPPEPAVSPPDANSSPLQDQAEPNIDGVALRFSGVSVQVGEQTILREINLTIAPGSKVAIVGQSGAGKSTLVKLLLGQYQPTSGELTIDEQPLTSERLGTLRQQTAWVDPDVQIWNRSFLYNLRYGGDRLPLSRLLDEANLRSVVEQLPDGMQSLLGERGRLVSGGQGQRVRLGRAQQRLAARLVVLDEPFRGLDRSQRANFLKRAIAYWPSATMLCVSHDLQHTLDFDRVLVIEGGQIVEDGTPADLIQQPDSRYRAMVEQEQQVRSWLWDKDTVGWRKIHLEGGSLSEQSPFQPPAAEVGPLNGSQPTTPDQTSDVDAQPFSNNDLLMLSWDATDAEEAIYALANASKLRITPPDSPPTNSDTPRKPPLAQRIETAAGRLGLEVESFDLPYTMVEAWLRMREPTLIQLANNRLLLLPGNKPWRTTVLAPNLEARQVQRELVRDLICHTIDGSCEADITQFLTRYNITPKHWQQARRALLHKRLHDTAITGVWVLRQSPGTSLWRQISSAGLRRYLVLALGGEAAISLLYVALFGLAMLTIQSSMLEWGWLIGLLLLLLLRIPAEMARWLGERFFGVGLRELLKRRLFFGVVHMNPDTVQQHGTGQFLGWLMESERLEQVAQAGPVILSSLVALLVCAGLLFVSAGGVVHSLLLLAFLALLVLIGRRALHAYLAQRMYHHQMTRDLVERMEGHQTRLVQENPEHWHEEEDQELAYYHQLSQYDDNYRTLITVLIPYGWLATSLLVLVPSFILYTNTWLPLGGSVLGTLWAFQIFHAVVPDLLDVIRSIGARQLLAQIEKAAIVQAEQALPAPLPANAQDAQQPLIEAQHMRFSYPQQERSILTDCTLSIYRGNRILLTGPSGSGKSTLAALVAGRRTAQGGLLLLYGFDRPTIGVVPWRRAVVIAPQFHENHIIDAPLAFNLLMGRHWPPLATDLAEAEALCRELGLGNLLDSMPRGIYEPVGETSWQLSHGERSRIYIARALLQGASLIVLDESFGSLDAQSMAVTAPCVLKQASTLLVISHP